MKLNHKIIKIIFIILIFEITQSLFRSNRRKSTFKKAIEKKNETGKQLLVVGSPNNGGWSSIIGSEYGCGDICTDIIGCSTCDKSIKGDLLDVLKSISNNSVVIFESCVLEYVSNLEEIKLEMKRVSGNDIFNVRIGLTLMNIYYFPSLWTKEPQIQNSVI